MKIKTVDGHQVIVDKEDYPVLSRLNWYISDNGYAITDSPVKHLKMHKLIIGPIPPKTVIDHINRDKLDNRKGNLRVVSQKINCHNSNKYELAKRYWYDKRKDTWVVEIKGVVKYLPVESPKIAERVVKRLMLGFPVDIAKEEAINPTIPISNWEQFEINYNDYLKAKEAGTTIKNLHRKEKRMKERAISRRGPKKDDIDKVEAILEKESGRD